MEKQGDKLNIMFIQKDGQIILKSLHTFNVPNLNERVIFVKDNKEYQGIVTDKAFILVNDVISFQVTAKEVIVSQPVGERGLSEYSDTVEYKKDIKKEESTYKTLPDFLKEDKSIGEFVAKVYTNGAFLRFQRIKELPKVGDIFILCHESKMVNKKALVVEEIITGSGFVRIYLKEE